MNQHAAMPEDVLDAQKRLAGIVMHTPLIENQTLNQRVGGRILLKAETLQHCNSFKVRGAYNLIAKCSPKARARGVIAWSSGNHAQGVAFAARALGASATIIMPRDAPAVKIANTRRLGAEIIFYDRFTEDRERIGTDLARARDAVLAPSYDHPDIIAGQGVVGAEMLEQAEARGLGLDAVLIPCGGGGLSSGIALALSRANPPPALFTVEPEGFDDFARSFAAGRALKNASGAHSICDALLSPEPGALTFPILQAYGAKGLVVSEQDVRAAVAFAALELKLVVEPGGAVALAATLSGKVDLQGKTAALVLSGGNLDRAMLTSILADAD